MCDVGLKSKVLILSIALLVSGVASAQMLDDETYGNWNALEIEQEEKQPTVSQDDFVPELPAVSTSSAVPSDGARLDDAIDYDIPSVPLTQDTLVSWSNDAIPPERIYEAKDVVEDAEGIMHEKTTGKLVTGEVRDRYPGGRLLTKVRYVDGLKHGRSIMFFQNGTLLSEAFYKDGKEEGEVAIFYANGDERVKVTFKDGAPVLGYCMTMTGRKIDMSTTQLREFQDDGKIPCDPQ